MEATGPSLFAKSKPSSKVANSGKDGQKKDQDDFIEVPLKVHKSASRAVIHPTSYLETLAHLVKGNIGAGAFAMGDAFKNGGLIFGSIAMFIIGGICIYNNHLLLNSARKIRSKLNLDGDPGYPETVELCFLYGPKNFSKCATSAKNAVKVFIVMTQLGFCCVYLVIVTESIVAVLRPYGIHYDHRIYTCIIFVPLLAACLIRQLKYLAPVSFIANVFLVFSIVSIVVICLIDIPPIDSRNLITHPIRWPLFLGTAIFAFEGITLVIPLQAEMERQEMFSSSFGVLNVGMALVMIIFEAVGIAGYVKYGEEVKGSLSLNLSSRHIFTDIVKILVGLGIVFSLPLQFYVPSTMIFYDAVDKWGPFRHELLLEMLLRTALMLFVLLISLFVPHLGFFISLIGAACSTTLALVFPALCDITLRFCPKRFYPMESKWKWLRVTMDVLSLTLAVVGFFTGTIIALKLLSEGSTADKDLNSPS